MQFNTLRSSNRGALTGLGFLTSLNPLAWANESLTRRLYKELDSDDLGAAYDDANLPVVEDQLERAGIRLAALLNPMFAPPAIGTASSQPATTSPASRLD